MGRRVNIPTGEMDLALRWFLNTILPNPPAHPKIYNGWRAVKMLHEGKPAIMVTHETFLYAQEFAKRLRKRRKKLVVEEVSGVIVVLKEDSNANR